MMMIIFLITNRCQELMHLRSATKEFLSSQRLKVDTGQILILFHTSAWWFIMAKDKDKTLTNSWRETLLLRKEVSEHPPKRVHKKASAPKRLKVAKWNKWDHQPCKVSLQPNNFLLPKSPCSRWWRQSQLRRRLQYNPFLKMKCLKTNSNWGELKTLKHAARSTMDQMWCADLTLVLLLS